MLSAEIVQCCILSVTLNNLHPAKQVQYTEQTN